MSIIQRIMRIKRTYSRSLFRKKTKERRKTKKSVLKRKRRGWHNSAKTLFATSPLSGRGTLGKHLPTHVALFGPPFNFNTDGLRKRLMFPILDLDLDLTSNFIIFQLIDTRSNLRQISSTLIVVEYFRRLIAINQVFSERLSNALWVVLSTNQGAPK